MSEHLFDYESSSSTANRSAVSFSTSLAFVAAIVVANFIVFVLCVIQQEASLFTQLAYLCGGALAANGAIFIAGVVLFVKHGYRHAKLSVMLLYLLVAICLPAILAFVGLLGLFPVANRR